MGLELAYTIICNTFFQKCHSFPNLNRSRLILVMRSRPDQKPGRKGSTKIVWKFKWTYEIYVRSYNNYFRKQNQAEVRTSKEQRDSKVHDIQKYMYMTGASSVFIKILIRKIIELLYKTSLNIVVTINVH